MTNKLQLYDIFSALVPGVLVLCAVGVAFPDVVALFKMPSVPDAFAVLALTVLALFLGHITQAIASLLEPVLHWTWGGRPSEKAMADGLGDRYLPKPTADRIAGKLKAVLGTGASDRSIFLYAMSMAEADSKSRASSFNGSYAYHRALLMLAVATVFLASFSGMFGALKASSWGQFIATLVVLVALTWLLWYRCKQRAFYYVREVLGTAERLLTKTASDSSKDNDK